MLLMLMLGIELVLLMLYATAQGIMIAIEIPFMLRGKITENVKLICWINILWNTVLPVVFVIFHESLRDREIVGYFNYFPAFLIVMVILRTLLKTWLYGTCSSASKLKILALTFFSNLVSGSLLYLCFINSHYFF